MIEVVYDCAECGARLSMECENGVDRKSVCLECGEPHMISIQVSHLVDSKKTYRNEAWLQTEYCDKERSMADIAKQCAVSPMTIFKWLKNHGIETRPTGKRR